MISKFPLSTLHSSLEFNTRPYLVIICICICTLESYLHLYFHFRIQHLTVPGDHCHFHHRSHQHPHPDAWILTLQELHLLLPPEVPQILNRYVIPQIPQILNGYVIPGKVMLTTSTTLSPAGRDGFLKFSFVKTKLASLAPLDIATKKILARSGKYVLDYFACGRKNIARVQNCHDITISNSF